MTLNTLLFQKVRLDLQPFKGVRYERIRRWPNHRYITKH